jgi:hypothetical protein
VSRLHAYPYVPLNEHAETVAIMESPLEDLKRAAASLHRLTAQHRGVLGLEMSTRYRVALTIIEQQIESLECRVCGRVGTLNLSTDIYCATCAPEVTV